jgi:hypothetical protein
MKSGLMAAGATIALLAATTSSATAQGRASEANDFQCPGADTIALQDGYTAYGTYGASSGGLKVPYSISGSGNTVGSSPVVRGDAMPGGGGAWAAPGSGIWTPGAFYHVKKGVGRYYLFYTATKRDSGGRKCNGVASSQQPITGFKAAPTPIVCPGKGDRWAIDADVTRGGGAIWMTWRDGQRAIGPESALSVSRLKFRRNGTVERRGGTRVLLRSDRLSWAHFRDGAGVTVIENPSAFYNRGSWYLFYSGNSWPTNYYATGIASCGKALADGPCTPLPGAAKAYFAYTGPKKALPKRMRVKGLPGNKRGPGAMDVYRARDGKPWVTWNYLSDAGGRKSRTGRLIVRGTGRAATFAVR